MTKEEIDINYIINIVAKKYRKKYNYMFEDITQEGWVSALAYIDRRNKGGLEVTRSGVLGAVKKAVYAYVNLKQLPVTVAVNSTTIDDFKSGNSSVKDIISVEALEGTLQAEGKNFLWEFETDQDAVHNLVECCLEGQQKEVIKLRYFEGKSCRAVASDMGISASTVSRIEHTALNILYTHV